MKTILGMTSLYVCTVVFIIVLADEGLLSVAGVSTSELMQMMPYFDKIAHFCLMGFLALLVNLSLSCRQVQFFGQSWLLGSMIVLVPVVAEEFSQLLIPGRSFDLGDLAADGVGIWAFGRFAVYLYQRRLLSLNAPMNKVLQSD